MKYLIEIATTDYESTKAAVKGGADRIELCSALTEGGLTPTFGLMKICREQFSVSLFPIIRPRAGDFLYSDEEFEIMLNDLTVAKEIGVDGIVSGFLKNDGRIDKMRTARFIERAYPMEFTFHRAFDRCLDPFEALEELIVLGCNRILTSGQQPDAVSGIDLIAELVRVADQRIVIMPGSGVRKDNIRMLAEKTGAEEFHSSVKSVTSSNMQFLHPSFKNSKESYSHSGINEFDVKDLKDALSK